MLSHPIREGYRVKNRNFIALLSRLSAVIWLRRSVFFCPKGCFAGDVFYTSAEGLADTPIWTQTALDAVGGKLSQQKVLCNVGYIMPGHGAMFVGLGVGRWAWRLDTGRAGP